MAHLTPDELQVRADLLSHEPTAEQVRAVGCFPSYTAVLLALAEFAANECDDDDASALLARFAGELATLEAPQH